jgi:hypothetical protein
MENTKQKKKRYGRLQTITATASIILVVGGLIAWLTPWVWYDNQPKPLGDGLEFVGKKDYGCWLGFCDSKPGATYYYATDMDLEEMEGYFKGAELAKDPVKEWYTPEEGGEYRFDFGLKENDTKGFYLIFYDNGAFQSNKYDFKSINRKSLVEIDYNYYTQAKSAL